MRADLTDRIMRAIEWMEANLHEESPSGSAAEAACLSEYHFQRLFKAMTGMAPGLYVRRRRLTEAAQTLLANDESVIRIALEAGYDSQEAFTRAFKEFFGVTPGKLRKGNEEPSMAFQPRLTRDILQHFTTGGLTLEPDFRSLPAFRVAGYGGVCEIGQSREIDRLWGAFTHELKTLNLAPDVTYGVCRGDLVGGKPGKRMRYLAGFEIGEEESAPQGMEIVDLPAGDYAVFTHTGGLATLEATVRHIWQCWIPRSGYELADAPDFERYDADFDHEKLEGKIEIWVPLCRT